MRMPRQMPHRLPFLAAALGLLLSFSPFSPFSSFSTAHSQTVYPTGTTIWDPTLTYDGYTLFAGADGVVYLIDMDGSVAKAWPSPIPGFFLFAVDPVAPGHVLAYIRPTPVAASRAVGELDFNGNLVWSYELKNNVPASASLHHDSERLANGNTLLLGVQEILVPQISSIPLKDDLILEIDPAGNIVWQWYTYEHVGEFGFSPEARELIFAQGGDWAHANSISEIPANNHTDPAFAPGNIIVSQRFTNTIFIIEKSTGDVVWKVGPEDHVTFGQHYPLMIPPGLPGEGNILVFDNGSGTGYPLRVRAPGYSRIQEIDPVTKLPVWTYTAAMSGQNVRDFWSDIVSGAQRLPNGNTLICQGARGRLFEVTSTGQIVWEYMAPYQAPSSSRLVFRAYRLDYSWAQ